MEAYKIYIRIALLAIVGLLSITMVSAQDQVYQKEVDRETSYIEAKKYLLIGRSDKAKKILEELLKTNRKNAAVAYEMHNLYILEGNREEALRYISRAIEYDPRNPSFLYKAAKLSSDMRDYRVANQFLRTLVEINPKEIKYVDMLSDSYRKLQEDEKAIQVYENLESLTGTSKVITYRKIEILDSLKRHREAIDVLENLQTIYPHDTDIMSGLAKRYIDSGEKEKARTVYSNILALDKDHAEANMAMAGNPDNPNDPIGYIKGLKPIIENANIPVKKKIEEIEFFLSDADKMSDSNQLQALADLAQKLKNTHPDNAEAYALYGRIQYLQKAYEASIISYEKALSLNNRSYDPWYMLMKGYEKTKQLVKLKDKAEEAIDYFPNKVTAYTMYARAQPSAPESLDYLEEAELIAGDNPKILSLVYTEKARCLIHLGKDAEAKSILLKATALDTSNTHAQTILSDISAWKLLNGIK